jgi:hypothetical protein
MTKRDVRYSGGAWVVTAQGGVRVSFRSADRGDALARAKRIVGNAGGGEVAVYDQSGAGVDVVGVPRRRSGVS